VDGRILWNRPIYQNAKGETKGKDEVSGTIVATNHSKEQF